MLRTYKENPRPAGLFAVRNMAEGTLFVGASTDLPGILNRQRFQLELGSHPDKALQADWNRLGPELFAFEVLDELSVSTEPGYDPREDLAVLCEMWLGKLSSAGQSLYPTSARSA